MQISRDSQGFASRTGQAQELTGLHEAEDGDNRQHQGQDPEQRFRGGRPGGVYGGLDSAARPRDLVIRHSAQPPFELPDAVAAVDEVGMRVDEPRRDEPAAEVRGSIVRRRGGSGSGEDDRFAVDHQRRVVEQAVGRVADHGRKPNAGE